MAREYPVTSDTKLLIIGRNEARHIIVQLTEMLARAGEQKDAEIRIGVGLTTGRIQLRVDLDSY